MPDRLSDVINVKDWGRLTGDGHHNDTTAIQTLSITACPPGAARPQAQSVFFHQGGIGSGLSLSVRPIRRMESNLIGASRLAVQVDGNVNGFIISQGASTYDNLTRIENLYIFNNNTTAGTGAVRVTGTAISIKSCQCGGMVDRRVGGQWRDDY